MSIPAPAQINLTTSERDSMSGEFLKAGIIIFNTDTKKFQGYNGSTWVDLH